MGEKTSRAAPKKKSSVKRMVELLKSYTAVGVIDLNGMPASQFQKIRARLKDKMAIVMARKRLIQLALKGVEKELPGARELLEEIKGMPALLFTKENPFTLYAEIKKAKSKAPIKPGQLAPYDLIIPAGPTPFAPGPAVSDFGALKIKTSVEGGKIVVKSDTLVAKKGEPVSERLASMLLRLGIMPMEVGLNVKCVLENGILYKEDVLGITKEVVLEEMASAFLKAKGLAIEICWPSRESIMELVEKAERNARTLAIEALCPEPEVMEEVIAKAQTQALSIQRLVK